MLTSPSTSSAHTPVQSLLQNNRSRSSQLLAARLHTDHCPYLPYAGRCYPMLPFRQTIGTFAPHTHAHALDTCVVLGGSCTNAIEVIVASVPSPGLLRLRHPFVGAGCWNGTHTQVQALREQSVVPDLKIECVRLPSRSIIPETGSLQFIQRRPGGLDMVCVCMLVHDAPIIY